MQPQRSLNGEGGGRSDTVRKTTQGKDGFEDERGPQA